MGDIGGHGNSLNTACLLDVFHNTSLTPFSNGKVIGMSVSNMNKPNHRADIAEILSVAKIVLHTTILSVPLRDE